MKRLIDLINHFILVVGCLTVRPCEAQITPSAYIPRINGMTRPLESPTNSNPLFPGETLRFIPDAERIAKPNYTLVKIRNTTWNMTDLAPASVFPAYDLDYYQLEHALRGGKRLRNDEEIWIQYMKSVFGVDDKYKSAYVSLFEMLIKRISGNDFLEEEYRRSDLKVMVVPKLSLKELRVREQKFSHQVYDLQLARYAQNNFEIKYLDACRGSGGKIVVGQSECQCEGKPYDPFTRSCSSHAN